MKLVFLGSKEECTGFSLAGAKSFVTEDDETFGIKMEELLRDGESGLIIVSDRHYGYYEEHISFRIKKRAIPAVIFVPSIEGRHIEKDIKGYISSVLGIRF